MKLLFLILFMLILCILHIYKKKKRDLLNNNITSMYLLPNLSCDIHKNEKSSVFFLFLKKIKKIRIGMGT